MLSVVLLVFAGGCSSSPPKSYWFHPDKTFDQIKADYRECEVRAQEQTDKAVEEKIFDGLRSPVVIASGDKAPARKKSVDPAQQAKADWGAFYRQRAFDGAMQGLGYIKVRRHEIADGLKTKELPLGAIAGKKP